MKYNNHKDKVLRSIHFVLHFSVSTVDLVTLEEKDIHNIFIIILISIDIGIEMESSKNEILITVYTYFGPILYVLGLTGSIASFVTLQSSKFSARIYVYLRSLALADFGFLIFAMRLLHLVKTNKFVKLIAI